MTITQVWCSVWVHILPSGIYHNPLCTSASCHLSDSCTLLCQHPATLANILELPALCIQGHGGKHLWSVFSRTAGKHSCETWPPINVTSNCTMTNNLRYTWYIRSAESLVPPFSLSLTLTLSFLPFLWKFNLTWSSEMEFKWHHSVTF